MTILISDLLYMNEAAKSLKQKDFIILENKIIGIDNVPDTLSYINLDRIILPFSNAIINQRNLSAFIKSLTIESELEVYRPTSNKGYISSRNGEVLNFYYDMSITNMVINMVKHTNDILMIKPTKEECEINDIANTIKSMNKADGSIIALYDKYHMTLFPSILYMNKADKLYVTIYDKYYKDNIFLAVFRIHKKKFDVMVFINYLAI